MKLDNGKILVLISDSRVSALVHELCRQHSDDVDARQNIAESVNYAISGDWSLLILHPDRNPYDTVESCQRVKTSHPHGQILVIAENTDHALGIKCLNHGADDLIFSPWSDMEFSARIGVAMRRSDQFQRLLQFSSITNSPTPTLFSNDGSTGYDTPYRTLGDIRLCALKREVLVHGSLVHLTRTEYLLFSYLLQHQNRSCSSSELLDKVLGYKDSSYLPSLHAHVSRLRRKLSRSNTTSIETIWCYGYRLKTN